jgi:hypothetical protein
MVGAFLKKRVPLAAAALAGGLALVPASVYAANTNIWAGESLTLTFQLAPYTHLNFVPATGDYVTVTGFSSETVPGGITVPIVVGSVTDADLIEATTNTFTVQFTVPAPILGTMWSNVYFRLLIPHGGVDLQIGDTAPDYNYVTPPVGQVPEVPSAAALPLVGMAAVGVWARTRGWVRRLVPSGPRP